MYRKARTFVVLLSACSIDSAGPPSRSARDAGAAALEAGGEPADLGVAPAPPDAPAPPPGDAETLDASAPALDATFSDEPLLSDAGCRRDEDCRALSPPPWGACEPDPMAPCLAAGSQRRTVVIAVCLEGTCATRSVIETNACSTPREGTRCADSTYTAWSSCTVDESCDRSPIERRMRTDYGCRGPECMPIGMVPEQRPCPDAGRVECNDGNPCTRGDHCEREECVGDVDTCSTCEGECVATPGSCRCVGGS